MFAIRKEFRAINSILLTQIRCVQTNDSLIDNLQDVVNKNPRNLELLTIARKPYGFSMDEFQQDYWHKIIVTKHPRYLVAEINHFENGVVLSASTKEWGLKKSLYSLIDGAAYMNLGRVIARRCVESGIFHVRSDLATETSENLMLFSQGAEKEGLTLSEPQQYKKFPSQFYKRPEKPWTVFE